ncbi:MAG TPA: phosphomannomutase/phosphoglucomutase [Gammaproteobacteria bacterium]|nr:phosphomannomutase/phosphoglucomutase [Gammaproteobacteria bacterium]
MVSLDSSIFRAYDIRGIVNQSLTLESVYLIGRAIGSQALEKNQNSIAVGFDGRISSPFLAEALCEGILSTGCDVLDVGMVPTPILYYATFALNTRSGVMITGSHNPPEYNGFKIVINGETLAEDSIQQLYQRIINNDFEDGIGEYCEIDLAGQYIKYIEDTVKVKRPLRIVIDAGNAVPGMVAPELYRRLECEVHELFCKVDGNFPNHHPDPSQAENLTALVQAVKEHQADVGIAFDGDGDRLGVVTPQGKVIWPDRQLILFAQAVLEKNPKGKIIYDVKCTTHLADAIRSAGGEPIMWKTGHSLVKAKLAETGALLAGEMSGHIFFKDRWFGFDDAIYAGARLLEILAEKKEDIDALFAAIPDSINTPELKISVAESEKFAVMDSLFAQLHSSKEFKKAEVQTIDGLRINFADGWGLVRPSNTTPCLVLRFEAINEVILKNIQEAFRGLLLSVNPNFALPF